MNPFVRRQSGVSLIEALVAVAVMAFGMLGIAGIQSNLRASSDISKQRSEAVRMAQEIIENNRAFDSLSPTADAGNPGFADIVATNFGAKVGVNATYSRELRVVDESARGYRGVEVVIAWNDRAGRAQSVRLNSAIAGATPEISGTLSIAPLGSKGRQPLGRSPYIPRQAIDQGDGTSAFSPPGAGTGSWVLSNNTGAIVRTCSAPANCIDVSAFLLSGYIRFATDLSQPTPLQAESPPSSALPGIEVVVQQTAPSSGVVDCFEERTSTYIAYYCAVPVTVGTPKWSGQSLLISSSVALLASDVAADKVRVCRYTRELANPLDPTVDNESHPFNYRDVSTSLVGQNFLVIRAGDGAAAYGCPGDDPDTQQLYGATWIHQPSN